MQDQWGLPSTLYTDLGWRRALAGTLSGPLGMLWLDKMKLVFMGCSVCLDFGDFFGIWYTLRVGCLVDPGVCGYCEVVGSEVY